MLFRPVFTKTVDTQELIFLDVIRRIIYAREKADLSQRAFSLKMGYSETFLNPYEAGRKQLTPAVLTAIKEALDAPRLPLTDAEDRAFKIELYNWKDVISFQGVEAATELYHQLKRTIHLMLESDLTLLFKLFEIVFLRTMGDTDAVANELKLLEPKAKHFNPEVAYWYNRSVGIQAMRALHYTNAVKYFLQAEALGNPLGLNNDTLYYNIGHCLSIMGFSQHALDYLYKASRLITESGHNRNSIWIRLFKADNHTYMGKPQDALKLLNQCLWEEKQKSNARISIGLIYRNIAWVYMQTSDYTTAIEHIQRSCQYITTNDREYTRSLHLQAVILIKDNKVEEGLLYLDEALKRVDAKSIIEIELLTTKHLCDLTNRLSRDYIEEVAIPTFRKLGFFTELLDCYDKLGFYYDTTNDKKSKEYMHLAYKLSEKLRKGDFDS